MATCYVVDVLLCGLGPGLWPRATYASIAALVVNQVVPSLIPSSLLDESRFLRWLSESLASKAASFNCTNWSTGSWVSLGSVCSDIWSFWIPTCITIATNYNWQQSHYSKYSWNIYPNLQFFIIAGKTRGLRFGVSWPILLYRIISLLSSNGLVRNDWRRCNRHTSESVVG